MERDVLHLSIPAFPIALARVGDVSLRGRPAAVAPGHSDRALLQCVSKEAAAEGVCEGMPVYRARRLCPALTLLPPDPQLLARGMRSLLEVSGTYTPVMEPSAAGRLFLDLTGCRRLLGPGRDAAARLEKEIAERLRLQGTVGVAGNKLVSRIASGYLEKPGVCDVLRGAERSFIAPLPVSVLPGVGAARESVLMRDLNLRRVEEVADLSVAQLRLAFGPFAPLLHQRACGIDPSPVQPPRRTPEIVEEAFPESEENDDRVLLAELCRLVEECGLRLRRLGKAAGRLVLTLTYADGVTEQGTAALPSMSRPAPLCRRRGALLPDLQAPGAPQGDAPRLRPARLRQPADGPLLPGGRAGGPPGSAAGGAGSAADRVRQGRRALGAQFRSIKPEKPDNHAKPRRARRNQSWDR